MNSGEEAGGALGRRERSGEQGSLWGASGANDGCAECIRYFWSSEVCSRLIGEQSLTATLS